MPHLSVVIPVYKAENCLHELHRQLSRVLSSLTSDWEVIYVEDCGGDRSWQIIRELARADQRVKGIQFSRNFGQHYGITAGLEASQGDYVVVMDCDLQQDPGFIPWLYSEAKDGYDMVLTQVSDRKHATWRNWGARLYNSVVNFLTGRSFISSRFTTLSLLSRPVVDAFLEIKDVHRHYIPILDYLGFSKKIIEISHKNRFSGKSSYNFNRLVVLTINGIISQSNRLLYITIALGFILVCMSLFASAYIVFNYFLSGYQSGWASTITVLLMLGGSLHIFLGIVGLYIGKIFDQVKQRPLFFIREKINFQS